VQEITKGPELQNTSSLKEEEKEQQPSSPSPIPPKKDSVKELLAKLPR